MTRPRSLRLPIPFALIALLLPACCASVSGVPPEALATVEGVTAAVNAYDTEATRGFVTEDFTWKSTGPNQTLDEYTAHVDAYYESGNLHLEITEDLKSLTL